MKVLDILEGKPTFGTCCQLLDTEQMSRAKDMSHFDKDQMVMARQLARASLKWQNWWDAQVPTDGGLRRGKP